MTRRNPASRESITLGDGDFRINCTRAEAGVITAALKIAVWFYSARSTGANTAFGRKLIAATHLHRVISGALTKGQGR